MKLQLKLSHKGLILVSVPLAFEVIFVFILFCLLKQAEIEVDRQERSETIVWQSNDLSKLYYDVGVAFGGYSITKSPMFADRFDKLVKTIPQDLEKLKQVIGDNPNQQRIMNKLNLLSTTGLKFLTEAKSAVDDNSVDVAQFRQRSMYKEIRSLADSLQEELSNLTKDEQKIASKTPEVKDRSRLTVKLFIAAGIAFNVLVALGLAMFFSRGIAKRLNVLTDNSICLARGEPLNEPLSGSDKLPISMVFSTAWRMRLWKPAGKKERLSKMPSM